jgi:hypothetical protein
VVDRILATGLIVGWCLMLVLAAVAVVFLVGVVFHAGWNVVA